jgi:mRNA interferase RelE/StbE
LAWTIEYSSSALKSLKKMDKQFARRIVGYLDDKVAVLDDPRTLGKALKGELGEYWRYRVGDYRVLCEIQDDKVIILAAAIGHRKEIYKA